MKDINSYYEALRAVRIQKGLTLKDVSEKIGCTFRALHYWEMGKKDPSTANFQKWTKALNMTIEIIPNGMFK